MSETVQQSTQNQPFKKLHLEVVKAESIQLVCLGFLISILGHFAHLPVWVSSFVSFALIWRLLQSKKIIPPIPRWLIVPFVLAGGIGVFATYWTITGRDAGLALLSVMAAFKLLESKSLRDALIIIFLSYFVVVTHFLFSQSIFIALYMMLTLLFLTAALVTLNERGEALSWKIRFKTSGSILLYSLPLMVILFVLVPRVPGPLWGLTTEQRAGVTGLSNHMSPGNISNLIRDNDVAFRVQFEGDVPPQQLLYWRGPVMSRFNGQTWFQTTRKTFKKIQVNTTQKPIEYTITMEANGKNWLLPLDLPAQVFKDSTLSTDFELKSTKPLNDLKKYTLKSYTQVAYGLDDSFEYLMFNTEFPEGLNKKTIALGQQLKSQYGTSIEIVNHVLNMFRADEYFYTLNPPLLGKNSVDDFLFDSKKGFCEHYASSFALLMRTAGIPTRIVTGYQGGEFNQAGQYLIVRQSDAHAWTEVWLDDIGWKRVDPTAAVSPDRIEHSLEEAIPDEQLSYRFKLKNNLISQLLFSWDNAQHKWNNWVINYNHRKQSDFLKNLGVGIKSTADMVIALVILLTLVTLSYALFSWYKNSPTKVHYYEQLLQQLLKKMSKAGYHRDPAETLPVYLLRCKNKKIIPYRKIKIAFSLYQKIKYSPVENQSELIEQFKTSVDQIKVIQIHY
ncbi:MAG: DUF3488 domain-containing transglutaminase family protein [Gammaproteobacteria bacterium]|nr:DUF3488 domain-containing transglutaminase family protein [Gammaproteobacteria bacterium]